MDILTAQQFNDLLTELEQLSLTSETWTKAVPVLDYDQLEQLITFFKARLVDGSEKLTKYFNQLVYYNQDEDRLTELLELLFKGFTDKLLERKWFNKFSSEFVTWVTSDLVIENFFLFLRQVHSRYPLQPESQILQTLEQNSQTNIRFHVLCFKLEQNLGMYINTEILQLFFSVPMDLQLQFIPILNNLSETKRIALAKEILTNKRIQTKHYIIISILFHMTSEISKLFESYELFKEYITSLKDKKTFELLFAEFTKPDAVNQSWIQQLLLNTIKEDAFQASYIVETSGEYLGEWPTEFRKHFLQLILDEKPALQVSLAKILSPLWHDEQIIKVLLKQPDEQLQEPLFESLVNIFMIVPPDIQQTVEHLFRTNHKNDYFLGLLLASNFQYGSFLEEIEKSLADHTNKNHELKLRGILIGLGMHWNELPDEIHKILLTIQPDLTTKLKRELLKGLEMIYVTLNVEGMNFVTELQSYDYQITPDDLELD